MSRNWVNTNDWTFIDEWYKITCWVITSANMASPWRVECDYADVQIVIMSLFFDKVDAITCLLAINDILNDQKISTVTF